MKLDYRVINNARVQAYIFPIVRYPDGFRGGPVLHDESDQILRHTRGRKPYDSFREDAIYERHLSGDYTLSGPIDGHFGHFMAEMVHRILPSRQLGLNNPLILVTSQDWTPQPTYAHFPSHVKEALNFLDVTESNVVLIKQNTTIERLHIVEAGSDLDGGPKPGYTDVLRDFAERRLGELHGDTRRPKKLYVSRSSLTPKGIILGETYLEAELEKEGIPSFDLRNSASPPKWTSIGKRT